MALHGAPKWSFFTIGLRLEAIGLRLEAIWWPGGALVKQLARREGPTQGGRGYLTSQNPKMKHITCTKSKTH
jgi:hypothetical protein